MKKIFSRKCVCKYFALDSVVIFPKLLLAKLFLTNLLGAPFQQMTFRQFLPQPPGLDLSERYFVQNKKFVIQLRRHRRIPFPNRRLPFVFFLSFLSFSPPSLPFPLNRCTSCSSGIQKDILLVLLRVGGAGCSCFLVGLRQPNL